MWTVVDGGNGTRVGRVDRAVFKGIQSIVASDIDIAFHSVAWTILLWGRKVRVPPPMTVIIAAREESFSVWCGGGAGMGEERDRSERGGSTSTGSQTIKVGLREGVVLRGGPER